MSFEEELIKRAAQERSARQTATEATIRHYALRAAQHWFERMGIADPPPVEIEKIEYSEENIDTWDGGQEPSTYVARLKWHFENHDYTASALFLPSPSVPYGYVLETFTVSVQIAGPKGEPEFWRAGTKEELAQALFVERQRLERAGG